MPAAHWGKWPGWPPWTSFPRWEGSRLGRKAPPAKPARGGQIPPLGHPFNGADSPRSFFFFVAYCESGKGVCPAGSPRIEPGDPRFRTAPVGGGVGPCLNRGQKSSSIPVAKAAQGEKKAATPCQVCQNFFRVQHLTVSRAVFWKFAEDAQAVPLATRAPLPKRRHRASFGRGSRGSLVSGADPAPPRALRAAGELEATFTLQEGGTKSDGIQRPR